MIGTLDIAINAKSPNMPLFPMRAFVNSPSSIRIVNVPKRIGKWCIDSVSLFVVYPDGTVQNTSCVLTGGVWTGTIEGTSISGRSENGYTVFADGTDENGNQVTGYILGKGDIEILEADGTLSPDTKRYYVKLLSAEAEEPREGDLYPTNSGYVIWQNGQANQLGTPFEQISAFVESEISAKADLSAIPTKTSELSNDSGFITSASVPTKTSDLTNDSNYITSAQVEPTTVFGVSGYAEKSYKAYLITPRDVSKNEIADTAVFRGELKPNPQTDELELDLIGEIDGKYPWNLSQLFGTQYSPAVRLNWSISSIHRQRGTRWSIVRNKEWMWVAPGQFAITTDASGNPDGNFYVLHYGDETHPNAINDPVTDVHQITVESGQGTAIYVATIDGQQGQITCTSFTGNYVMQERPLAYRDELSAKADVAELDLKQDKLSDAQVSAIDSVVDERKTVVKYDDNSIVAYDIDGTLSQNALDISGKNIIEVKIGNAVTAIGPHCFDSYKQLVNVYIPNSVTTIDSYAFIECDNLTGLLIPESVTTIGDYAFYGCESLTGEVIIPDSVTSIGEEVFVVTHCPKFVIGSGVTNIGRNVFLGNGGRIEEVTFKGKMLAEVQSMANYPWSIGDTSIIKTYNVASKEWVLEQLSALEARIAALEGN